MAKKYIQEFNDLRDKEIKGTIAKHMEIKNAKAELICKATGMKRTHFYECKKNPSLFRISELRAIYDFLQVPQEERKI